MVEIKKRKVVVCLELEPTDVPLTWLRKLKEIVMWDGEMAEREFVVHNVRAWVKKRRVKGEEDGYF